MNNRVTITFSRDFVAGDSISVYYSNPSSGTSGYWTFVWVSASPAVFEVKAVVGSTVGQAPAENLATSWSNSLNGFTVTQPVGGNVNQVQITSQTYHFVNVLAKFANGSTMAIPENYQYSLSTVSTGNKITYEDKLPLNLPAADSKYLWRSVNANEVKEKHNLNDDRISALYTDKADLVGGNEFTGNQTIDGNVGIGNVTSPTGKLQVYEGGNSSYKTYETTNAGVIIQSYQSNNTDFKKTTDIVAGSDSTTPSEIRMFTRTNTESSVEERLRIDSEGNLGIGTETPSEKLEVDGTIKTTNLIATNDLGIGTTTPSEKLEVNGAAKIVNSLEVGQDLNVLNNLKVDGSLGIDISSSTPSEKLEVEGNVLVKGNIYEHFTITSLTSSYNLTNSSRFLLYSLSSNGTITIPSGLGANPQEWKIVNASTTDTLTVSTASGVSLNFINNDGNNAVISAGRSATLVRYQSDGYSLIKY